MSIYLGGHKYNGSTSLLFHNDKTIEPDILVGGKYSKEYVLIEGIPFIKKKISGYKTNPNDVFKRKSFCKSVVYIPLDGKVEIVKEHSSGAITYLYKGYIPENTKKHEITPF